MLHQKLPSGWRSSTGSLAIVQLPNQNISNPKADCQGQTYDAQGFLEKLYICEAALAQDDTHDAAAKALRLLGQMNVRHVHFLNKVCQCCCMLGGSWSSWGLCGLPTAGPDMISCTQHKGIPCQRRLKHP